MADCAGSLQNMQLAACSLGLGACWVNQVHWLTDVPSMRTILEGLGMLPEENVYGSMVVGYAADPLADPPPRKEGRIIIHR
jgi:nitroreductase